VELGRRGIFRIPDWGDNKVSHAGARIAQPGLHPTYVITLEIYIGAPPTRQVALRAVVPRRPAPSEGAFANPAYEALWHAARLGPPSTSGSDRGAVWRLA
jgi:hypothetical protein